MQIHTQILFRTQIPMQAQIQIQLQFHNQILLWKFTAMKSSRLICGRISLHSNKKERTIHAGGDIHDLCVYEQYSYAGIHPLDNSCLSDAANQVGVNLPFRD